MSDGSSSGSGSASSTRGWAWLRYASAGLVAASTFVMAQSDWEEINVYPMLEHTLEAPFSYDGGLENWLFSGATIPQVQKIALVPPVAERHGIMWHRTPVITNDLEFQAQIDVKSVPVAPSDEGFGFFYVADNLNATFPEQQFVDASSWTQAMTDFGFNNGVGYKKRYKGLGVFFTVDSRGLGVVSGQVSDGNEDVVSDVFGTRQIVNFDWRRAGKFTLYVRVGVDVEVSIRQPSTTPGGQETVTKVMFAPAPAFDAGASVGFTAWSGTKKGVADQHDAIAVTNVAAWDHDLNKGYVGIDSEFDWEKGVHSQTDQREAIEALTASINRHINELLPKEEQMMQDIYTLQDRVQRLHDDVTFFSTEVSIDLPVHFWSICIALFYVFYYFWQRGASVRQCFLADPVRAFSLAAEVCRLLG